MTVWDFADRHPVAAVVVAFMAFVSAIDIVSAVATAWLGKR